MASGANLEQVSIEEAVKRLVEVDKTNSNKISRLESQIDEICKNFEEYREQTTSSTKEELRNMSERISEIQSANAAFQQETNSKLEEIKYHWNRMYTDMKGDMNMILLKLNEASGPTTSILTTMLKKDAGTLEDEKTHDIMAKDIPVTPDRYSECPVRRTVMADPINPTRTFQMSPQLTHSEPSQPVHIPTALPFSPVKHSIIVLPASAAPAFYGKPTESPTQFLIRIQEYAESVHSWDRATLVNGISQFLRESALEWYCQLRLSHRRPQTWTEFMDLFLAQYNSPVRKARQEQEWHECKQKENETINEFLVRLRAL
jgi:hypothetical protein